MSLIQRLVAAVASLIAGVLAYKDKIKSLESEKAALVSQVADLTKQVDQNGGLSDALKAKQAEFDALVAQNAEDNIEATNIIASAEQTAQDVHNDPEIPVTIDNGAVVADNSSEHAPTPGTPASDAPVAPVAPVAPAEAPPAEVPATPPTE